MPKSHKQSFSAKLEAAGRGGVFVTIPFSVEEIYGTRGRVAVKATFDGEPYRGSLASMGGGVHMLGVLKEIRQKIGKEVGDTIKVVIEPDTEPREVEIPADLQKAFSRNKAAKAIFEKMPYTHKKEYVNAIIGAKKPETRARRIEKTIEMLLEKAAK